MNTADQLVAMTSISAQIASYRGWNFLQETKPVPIKPMSVWSVEADTKIITWDDIAVCRY